MSTDFELEVQPRDAKGKGASRRLRRAGQIPAVIYGGGAEPRAISLERNSLIRSMGQEGFFTSILTVTLNGDSQAAVVKDVQRHPYKRQILHLDFLRVLEDEKITLNVPIRFLGEEVATGVREQDGVLSRLVTDVEVSCLPRDLPDFLELDVSELELNQTLLLSDIVLPEGVELVALAHDQDGPVVGINPPRMEEEEEEVEPEEGEEGLELAEGEEAPTPEEGAAPEGEEAPKDESSE